MIGASVQEVQMSGIMTGRYVGAYPSSLLTDEVAPRFYFGAKTTGKDFFCQLFFKEK